jgi:hypothetical protein
VHAKYPILIKIYISRQILVKIAGMKFNENPFTACQIGVMGTDSERRHRHSDVPAGTSYLEVLGKACVPWIAFLAPSIIRSFSTIATSAYQTLTTVSPTPYVVTTGKNIHLCSSRSQQQQDCRSQATGVYNSCVL